MSRTPVRKYQSAMAKKQFLTTHQGIAFDTNTRLIDGQHRLEANAGLPAGGEVTLLVTWNLPPRQTAFGKLKIDTQDNMDNTKGRSIRSTLSDQGWIRAKAFASTLNALSQSAGQCTNPGLSIDMALAILDIFRPEFKELDQAVMPLVCDRAGINAALILLLRLHPEATRNFIKALQAAPNRSLQRSDLGYTAPELLVHRYANNHRVDRCWSWSAVQMRNTLKAFTVFFSAPTARWQYLRDTNAFETTYLEQLPNEVTSIRTAIGKKGRAQNASRAGIARPNPKRQSVQRSPNGDPDCVENRHPRANPNVVGHRPGQQTTRTSQHPENPPHGRSNEERRLANYSPRPRFRRERNPAGRPRTAYCLRPLGHRIFHHGCRGRQPQARKVHRHRALGRTFSFW